MKNDLVRHICRYLKLLLPDCLFDVSATARYTRAMRDICLRARKHIAKGSGIKYLNGTLVPQNCCARCESESEMERRRHNATRRRKHDKCQWGARLYGAQTYFSIPVWMGFADMSKQTSISKTKYVTWKPQAIAPRHWTCHSRKRPCIYSSINL